MSKFIEIVKHEAREAVFPTIFFFCVFHFMIITKALILASYDLQWVAAASATIGALIVAKAILIVNVTPAGRMFRETRLIYHIIWRSILYSTLVLVFRYAEELIPVWMNTGAFVDANRKLFGEISWPKFWAIQLWLLVSITLFSAIVTIDEYLGPGSLKKALFGTADRRDPAKS